MERSNSTGSEESVKGGSCSESDKPAVGVA